MVTEKAKYMRQWRSKNIAKGLCRCGKEKDVKTFLLCNSCRSLANAQNLKHKAKRITRNQKKLIYLRELVFEAYGNQCSCCKESNQVFLTIDHINSDGASRRSKEGSGNQFYRWIIANNFPDDLQLLCFNCNCVKNPRGGRVDVCPHKIENEELTWYGC